ncbi:hypothetical protein XBLMG947_2721 [Xanthomonas bromi]|uniref:Uncharacterized protein n=1 Tax=Xanthomonas bromi TaxID=56449 RepID=A0A1C3NNH8_9XANT|nr:hypothetical protein XBLMG947_2721 [Xanthomonas bromi]
MPNASGRINMRVRGKPHARMPAAARCIAQTDWPSVTTGTKPP